MMGIGLGLPLWQLYGAIPRSSQEIIQRWVSAMVKGMRGIGDPQTRPAFVRRKGIEVLESEVDYNEYCYYVAGTVGQLASGIVVEQYQLAPEVAARLHARAESCGRSLQKTNIIKDFVEDLKRGVCYLPDTWMGHAAYAPLELGGADLSWKAMVLGDALNEMRDSLAYVLALPVHAKGYRRASLMCLYPAYHTMLSAARQADLLFTAGHQIKISRLAIAQMETEEAGREAGVAQAKAEFELFIKNNPKHARVAEAQLALAQVTAVQAIGQLHRAKKTIGSNAAETAKRRKAAVIATRPLFKSAAKLFGDASKNITAQLGDTSVTESRKKELQKASLQAELDRGLNQCRLVETY